MIDVLNLALPYFGLIFLGFACGKLRRIPDTGLAWMNFFIVHVALPCLFYRIVAKTPLEELDNVPFVVATTLRHIRICGAFRGQPCDAPARRGCDDRRARRRLRQYRLYGPGACARDARRASGGAGGADILLRQHSVVFARAVPDGIGRRRQEGLRARPLLMSQRRSSLHPFIVATALGVASAAIHFEPPIALDRLMQFLQNAAAPCALFVLGVTVALRPLARMPWEVPVHRHQALRSSSAGACDSVAARPVPEAGSIPPC